MRAYDCNISAGSLTAAATTVWEISAGTQKLAILTRATLAQQSNTTSAQQGIQIARQSTNGTNVTSPVATPADISDTAITAAVRGLCTTQGTIGAILYPDAFNWQNGWLYLPVPEERITVSGATTTSTGLRTLTTPPAVTISTVFSVLEIG
jgi:hypothetical protein